MNELEDRIENNSPTPSENGGAVRASDNSVKADSLSSDYLAYSNGIAEESNGTSAPSEIASDPSGSDDGQSQSNESGSEVTHEAESGSENAPETELPSGVSPDAAPDEKTEAPVYTWSFAGQLEKDKAAEKKKRKSGALVYSIVITVLFALCFTVLIVLLATGFNGTGGGSKGSDRVIYVREYDSSSGLLTIPEVVNKCMPSTVGISVTYTGGTGVGTGIVMTESGYIATNYHVIENAEKIKIIMYDETFFTATYIGGDELSDLALLKIEPGSYKLTPAEFGDSDSLIVGEDVIAIGNPAGLDYAGTVTSGIISAINRDIKIYDDNGLVKKRMTLVQTSAILNPGNSGGPLIDMYGRVIGINTMKLSDEYEGIGFAIPSTGAVKILTEIMEKGSYSGSDVAQKGVSIGVTCSDVEKGVAVQMPNGTTYMPSVSGVMVISVTPSGSADGYLKPNDIITAVDGVAVLATTEIRTILLKHYVGDVITLTVYRDGVEQKISFALK